jgi:hypothetical protein
MVNCTVNVDFGEEHVEGENSCMLKSIVLHKMRTIYSQFQKFKVLPIIIGCLFTV